MVSKKLMNVTFLMLIQVSILAQESDVKAVKNVFQGTKFINLQSTNTADKNVLNLFIQHRFGDINGGFYEFFGLDQASMRLGFEYGLFKNFNIGIGRSTYMKTFDSYLKYRIFTQTGSFPLSLAVTVSGSVPTIKDVIPEEFNKFADKASGNAQLHLSKSFKRFGFQLSPGYITTGYIPVENNKYSFFTLAAGGSVRISKKVSVNVEYLYRFEDNIDYVNPLSVAVDLDTGGHLFQLIVSNTQQMFDQAIITNPVGDWSEGSLFLGFNLIREFNFKQYE